MPSATDEDEELWIEIEKEMLLGPGRQPGKLKFCSDASVSQALVEELRARGISTITAYEAGVSSHSDDSILDWSRREDRVLLTMDHHFWDDSRFPLQTTPGVLYLDVPNRNEDALQAFGQVYQGIGRFGSWRHLKIRATPQSFFMKSIGWGGKLVRYEGRVVDGRGYVREGWPSNTS